MHESYGYELRMLQNTAAILYQRKISLEKRIAFLKSHPTGNPAELRKALKGKLYTVGMIDNMAEQLRKRTGKSLAECKRSLSEVATSQPTGYEIG